MRKVLVIAALAVACGGGKNVKGSGEVTTPDWVAQGTGAFALESGKTLHGVGSANAADPKARRQAADAAAAQQLAGGVEVLAGNLTKMSQSSQDNLGDAIAAITRAAAGQAAAVRDHWVTPDGQEAALEVLDLGAFRAALQVVDGDDKLKKETASNAEKAFDTLMQH
jgi:hypothetical protein